MPHSEQPEACPFVSGANVGRGEQTPFRMEPELGKVVDDERKPGPNKSGDVLQEHESRSHLSHDPGNVRPEPSLIVNTSTLPGCAERLAVEACGDDVDVTCPGVTVECRDVIPDRCSIQGRLTHPRHKSGRCVAVPLNTRNGSYVDSCELEADLESAVSVEEAQGT